MGSGLDVKIFFLLQPAGVGQGVATPLVGAFHHHFLQSLSNRFLMRQQIPFRIDFYVRQRVGNWRLSWVELAGMGWSGFGAVTVLVTKRRFWDSLERLGSRNSLILLHK